MKKHTVFAILFVVSICSSINAQSTRTVESFDGIETSGNVSVTLIKSSTEKVEIEMLRGNESDVTTKVKDKTLLLGIKNKNRSTKKNAKAKVKVYYKTLDDVEVSAGSSIKSEDVIVNNDMDIEVSSGGAVSLKIETKKIDIEVSSGGSLTVSGSSNVAEIDASSGASIDALKLECETLQVEASSGSSISCYASKSLEAETSSGASISYAGNPKKTKIEKGFSGSVISKD